jgi:hypothetical protein
MIKNQPESNSGKPAPNRLLFPLVILSIFVLSLLFVDVFAVYALSSNSDALSIVSEYQTWANNRFLAELGRVADAHSQLASTQTQLDSVQQQLASAQAKIILYQNTYGEIESGDAHPFLGPDGQWITLVNNPLAADPTYAQLERFILSDTTDQNIYVPGVYECTDFARDVYNNAEKAGIRTAYVGMVFSVSKIGHALDAFQTTDKGLVFIDCTGLEAGEAGPSDNDKIVTVKKGDYYTYIYMDEVNGQQLHRTDLGTITDVQLDW